MTSLRLAKRDTTSIVGALVALKIALLFALAWNRRIVMDEFEQLGWAKYLGHGLFETISPSKAVGFQVFIKIAHFLGTDAVSILHIGRMQTALLACGTLAIVYGCARAIGNDRLRAMAIVLVLLCFTNFIERIFETRAEPLATFFAAAALLVVLRGSANRPPPIFAAGVLAGLSFLSTQKAVYLDVALGLALVGDACLAPQYRRAAIMRGAWFVAGWVISVALYCFVFGGSDPLRIARTLVLGPLEVATHGADAYGSLRFYVGQTLARNSLLYVFSFAGMAFELARIAKLDGRRRIALIFSIVVTAFVFAHNQPWPYVFVMALPFIALWALVLSDRLRGGPARPVMLAALGVFIAASFVENVQYLGIANADQLALITRAEALVGPNDVYFDGIGMLPNRREPSTLWLDRASILTTLREGRNSEAYRIFDERPPKLIIWSYRMEGIRPVVGPRISASYVAISPNLRIAGKTLNSGQPVGFDVPVAGRYGLYDLAGQPLGGELEVDGKLVHSPLMLPKGPRTVTMRSGPMVALLLPQSSYAGRIARGSDDPALFAGVYD